MNEKYSDIVYVSSKNLVIDRDCSQVLSYWKFSDTNID